jgi:heme oxygenase
MSLKDHYVANATARRYGASALRRQLKRETAGLHQRLEAELGLLEPELSIDRYRQVLQSFLGFYAPVEAGLARLAAAASPIGFPMRARSEVIEGDLLSLGLSRPELAALPQCTDLPRLSCIEEMAGCLYVLEGACLGGQVIAPALHQRLGVAKGGGASFFIGDAEGTAARWTLFLAWLDGLVRAGAHTEEIVVSACATFLTFARWVETEKDSQPPVCDGEGTPWST